MQGHLPILLLADGFQCLHACNWLQHRTFSTDQDCHQIVRRQGSASSCHHLPLQSRDPHPSSKSAASLRLSATSGAHSCTGMQQHQFYITRYFIRYTSARYTFVVEAKNEKDMHLDMGGMFSTNIGFTVLPVSSVQQLYANIKVVCLSL